MIVLAYLWLLALVPVLVEREDAVVRWHAVHGTLLMVTELVLWIGLLALQVVVGSLVGLQLGAISILAAVAILALHVAAIAKGLGGGRLTVPGLSRLADRF